MYEAINPKEVLRNKDSVYLSVRVHLLCMLSSVGMLVLFLLYLNHIVNNVVNTQVNSHLYIYYDVKNV